MTEIINDVLGDPVFAICALISVMGALTVVSRRNPIHGALGLMLAFLAFAVLFIRLNATFLAAMHVLVYTGAILVLFLFVIMLLNLSREELGREYGVATKGAIALLVAVMCGLLLFAIGKDPDLARPASPIVDRVLYPGSAQELRVAEDGGAGSKPWGGVDHVGTALFGRWIFPFELVSVLIIVAILGAVVLAKRKLPPES
ncbi:MAG: NADH-quinone oxidoreductase subunit J [Planctomycetes bacterium]|nr:NADH-quinone oxidoreductase subunit J [Planctomycetota bacterium]